ncbi:MAG: hypothetical protein R3C03_00800 [Pirellulaceae bacterium]
MPSLIKLNLECLAIGGSDAKSWFHNFCTADIKRLALGDSTEAFVLDAKGKTLGWGTVVAEPESLLLIMSPGQIHQLSTHLERYVIREDVAFVDASEQFEWMFVFGEDANHWLQQVAAIEPATSGATTATIAGQTVQVVSTQMFGPGLLLRLIAGDMHDAWLSSLNLVSATLNEFKSHRIQHRCPEFGTDFDESALPQELRRDDLAISFDKGCYLGQETVARIDALGHVNRVLVVLRSTSAETFQEGAELTLDGSVVGTLTSVASDAEHAGSAVALALTKRKAAKPGTVLQVGGVECEVIG